MRKLVILHNICHKNYSDAWSYQKKLAAKVSQSVKLGEVRHYIIAVQHDPVYTIGIRSKDYDIELERKLLALGAEFCRTNRGGLITFHGPGQLVLYPILHLPSIGKGLRWYVSALERSVIQTCHTMGLLAQTSPHTGVWIGDNKICAIGIQGRRVTTHGLAINCNVDLNWFSHIVPCGIEGKGVTSFSKELNEDVNVNVVLPKFIKAFEQVFDCDIKLPDDDDVD